MARKPAAKGLKKKDHFKHSAIVARAFPPNPLVGKWAPGKYKVSKEGYRYYYARLTKEGKQYSMEIAKIRCGLSSLDLDKRRKETILAFCKNWYIKKKTLPSMRTLRKLFNLPEN